MDISTGWLKSDIYTCMYSWISNPYPQQACIWPMIHWCIFSSGVTSNFGSPARKSCKALSPLLPPSLLHIPSPFALTFCPLPFCPLLFPLRALFLQLGPFSASRRSGVCYELPQCFVGQNPGRKCILEHFVTSETTSGDIKFCVFAKKINSIIFDPQDRQHYFVLPWTGFSTDAQSPWVSQLVLLASQIKPMPMMVFCSLTARPNGQRYWPPLILLLRPWDYTHHSRKRTFRILATVHRHRQFTCRPVDKQSKQ